MENNLFKGKTIAIPEYWEEWEKNFVRYHIKRMGGFVKTDCLISSDFIIHYNYIAEWEIKEIENIISKNGRGKPMPFDELQRYVLAYITKEWTSNKRCIEDKEFMSFSEIEEIVIPETVKEIGAKAFYRCKNLKNIILPKGLKYIGNEAFCFCESLKNIILPDGLKHIGEKAFYGCSSLENIEIPEGITEIEKRTFTGSSLRTVKLPESLKVIGEEAFAYNELVEIRIPEGVEEIGELAFRSEKMETVTVPSGVKKIGSNAFADIKDIKIFDSFRGNIDIKDLGKPYGYDIGKFLSGFGFTVTVISKETGETKFVIPVFMDGTKEMWECFESAWDSVKMEFEFDKIDSYFNKIKQDYVKRRIAECRMNNPVFMSEESKKMYSAYLERSAPEQKKIANDSVFEIKRKRLVKYLGKDEKVVVPEGITIIGEDAFSKTNRKITEIIVPEGVTTIEGDAFSNIYLEKLTLPDTITNVENYGIRFRDLRRLNYNVFDNGLYIGNEKNPYVCFVRTTRKDIKTITVHEGCRVICGFAFADCLDIRKINLPDSVINIVPEPQWLLIYPGAETEKDIYLRRKLKMNMPKGYLRRAERLPSTFIYDLITTKWRDQVTIEDFAWLYLFQNGKKLSSVCELRMNADPNRAVIEMNEALKNNPKKGGIKKAAEYVIRNKSKIDQKNIDYLYEITVSAKEKEVINLLRAIATTSDSAEIFDVVAEEKHVALDKTSIKIADGVNIIPKGFLTIYCDSSIQSITLPDSVKLLEEPKLPKNIKMNMPEGYVRRKEKLPVPPKFMCDLLAGSWRDFLTLTDYAYLYLFQGGERIEKLLCSFELGWDPDVSVKELIKAIEEDGKASHYQKVAQFIDKNQVYISKETIHLFLDSAKARNFKRAINLVEPTLNTEKKNVWEGRKPIEVFCHDNFSNYRNIHITSDAYINTSKGIYYKDTDEIAPRWVVECAVAPYVDLFDSIRGGNRLEVLPKADKVAAALDQKSLIKAYTEIAENNSRYNPRAVIPICIYADEGTVYRIWRQILTAELKDVDESYKKAAIVASEALLLNKSSAARRFAKSIGRTKDYEKIHK